MADGPMGLGKWSLGGIAAGVGCAVLAFNMESEPVGLLFLAAGLLCVGIGFFIESRVDSRRADKRAEDGIENRRTIGLQPHRLRHPIDADDEVNGFMGYYVDKLGLRHIEPGPWDQHIPHGEYDRLATNECFRGSAFKEPDEHPLDLKRAKQGEIS